MSTPLYPLSSIRYPRRLLVRGVNWLGDAVMTTPALLRLREALPDTRITLLTHEKLAGLWQGHPAVDEVMTFAAKEGVFSVARRLRRAGDFQSPSRMSGVNGGDWKSPARGFDAALVLPNSIRTGLEVRLAGIPRRIGYAGSWRDWLLTEAVPWRKDVVKMRKRTAEEVRRLVADAEQSAAFRPQQAPSPDGRSCGVNAARATSHHIFHYLHLAAALGAKPEPLPPLIAVTEAEVAAVKAKFQLSEGLLIGLNAGAEYGPAKRWPAERFIATAKGLRARLNCGFVIFGGPADAALAMELATALAEPVVSGQRSAVSVTNLAGRTSLRELCAALRACRVVLTNDSGPMHLAAAVGTRVVALFGSTSPELTCPGLPGDARHILLRGEATCSPCFLRECPIDFRCMNSLAVAAVVDAVGRSVAMDL